MDVIFRVHAVRMMVRRGVTRKDVVAVIEAGETIESYPNDTPYPSRLVLGRVDGRPLHVVVATNAPEGQDIVVTVYEPDPSRWDAFFRHRKA